ncbi:hypothetical protein ACFLZM_05750 [Thermodesulfobacteriota bacterium]
MRENRAPGTVRGGRRVTGVPTVRYVVNIFKYYDLKSMHHHLREDMDNHLFDRIKRAPKIELHLHLEGGVRQSTLLEFLKKRGENASLGNTTITNEYYILAKTLGFSFSELKKVTLNAVNGAFLEENEKKLLHQEIENDFLIDDSPSA